MTFLIAVQVKYPLQPVYSVGCLIGTCLLHTFVLEDEKEEHRQELEKLLKQEKKHKKELGTAKFKAYTDSLTGVSNKHAYVEAEAKINRQISSKKIKEFAIVVFDLNGLKEINDTKGHDEGDRYLKTAVELICIQFKNSKIFRIGGDEFIAILEGEDYKNRKGLLSAFERRMENNQRKGLIVIATGMEDFNPERDKNSHSVFDRADKKMYERKKFLKNLS